MDILSAILFAIVGFALASFYKRLSALDKDTSKKLTAHEQQLGHLVSNADSEKGTRRRINHDFENRFRRLEGRPPLPPSYDNSPEAS